MAQGHFRDSTLLIDGLVRHEMLPGKQRAETLRTIEEIERLGGQLPSAQELFRRLDLSKFYDTMYRLASWSIHTALPTIDEKVMWAGNDAIAGFRFGPHFEKHPTTLGLATDVFVRSLRVADSLLGLGLEPRLRTLQYRLETMESGRDGGRDDPH